MDENQNMSYELQRLQSSITSLFETLVNEKNKFKHEKEKSISTVETLVSEITNLRKENELLRKSNSDQKSACETCMQLKEKLLIQNRRFTKLEKNLNALRKFIIEVPHKVSSPQFLKLLTKLLDELECDDSHQKQLIHEDIHFFRSTFRGNNKSLIEEQNFGSLCTMRRSTESNFDEYTKTSNEKVGEEHAKEQRNSQDVDIANVKTEGGDVENSPSYRESQRLFQLVNAEFNTPKKVKPDTDFIDSSFKKGEISPILLSRLQVPSPNQFKRKANELVSGSPGKVVEKKLFLKSPNQKTFWSPAKDSRSKFTSQLKFSNCVEAEISLGGVKKLKQTQLNVEFYKSKNKEEKDVLTENINENDFNLDVNHDESKFGEDDIILESPKHPGNSFDDFKKNVRLYEEENGGNNSKPTKRVVDPEETFVGSFYLRESSKQGSKESQLGTETPSKACSRSPEYNSVPYLYKGSPVRKKSERMKLPGQMCMECNKYYKAILGEVDSGKMQEILNQCSRHRDRHYNVVQTPPGYWKPYLTATMDLTMQDDDTCLD